MENRKDRNYFSKEELSILVERQRKLKNEAFERLGQMIREMDWYKRQPRSEFFY